MINAQGNIIDECMSHKIVVTNSPFGDGTYAKVDISQGEVIECGFAKPFLPGNCEGKEWDAVLTWSDDGSVWATATGASAFYNIALDANTKMERDFEKHTYIKTALRDIKAGEPLTHTYRSDSELPQSGREEEEYS